MNLQLEQESLQGRQEDLKEISVEMIRLTSDFNEIFNRLGTMQQIWTMVRRCFLKALLIRSAHSRYVSSFKDQVRCGRAPGSDESTEERKDGCGEFGFSKDC